MKYIKTAILFSVLIFALVKSIVDVSANGGFTLTAQRFDSVGNPIADSLIEFTDGTQKIYTNDSLRVRLTWEQEPNQLFNVFYLDGSTPVQINNSAIPSPYDINQGADLPDGQYTIYVKEVGGSNSESSRGILVIDNSVPNAATGLNLTTISDTPLSTQGNLRTFNINWSAAFDTPLNASDPVARYEVRYNYTGISETVLKSDVTGTSYTVVLSDSVPDTTITFLVYTVDLAGNRNTTPATINYVLNTTPPNPVSNVVIRNATNDIITGNAGGNFSNISFSQSNSADVDYYEISIKVDATSNYVVLSSGSKLLSYNSIFDAVSINEGAQTTIRVVVVDTGGNRSSEVLRVFRYDSVPPAFDVRFLDRSVSPAIYLTASGNIINSQTISSIQVVDNLSDIRSYIVERNNVVIKNETGTSSSLEAYLRTLTQNGIYRVIVQDAAFNRSTLITELKVQAPTLPTNRSLVVNGNDTRTEPGFDGAVSVEFLPAEIGSSGTYKLFVNGRPILSPTVQSTNDGKIRLIFDVRTVFYGDLAYIYEVHAVDSFGNIGKYNQQSSVVLRDIVIPTARIVGTRSNDTSIEVDIDLQDFTRSLTSTGAKAELYNGTVFVTSLPLTPGLSTYTFTNLRDRVANYNIKIVGSYSVQGGSNVVDATLNGASNESKYLIETLKLNPDVTAEIENLTVSETGITLDVRTLKNVAFARTVDVFVFEGTGPYTGNPVKSSRIDLAQSTSSTVTNVVITGLTVGKNYHIQVREGGYVIATARAVTNLPVPTTSFSVVDVKDTEITYTLTLNNSTAATGYLFQGNTLVLETGIPLEGNLNRKVITALDANTTYTLKVISTYNVYTETQDGSVILNTVNNALLDEFEFKTAKETPTATIPESLIEQVEDDVLFTVLLDDPDNAIINASAVLYLGDTIVDEIAIDPGRSNLRFQNLTSSTSYIISIHVTYDLNDGEGEITKFGRLAPSAISTSFVIQDFKTFKAIPDAEMEMIESTNESITVRIQPIDPDAAFIEGTVKLFGTATAPLRVENLTRSQFQRGVLQSFVFTGLEGNTAYRVEVEVDYNIEDDFGVRTYKPSIQTFRTRPDTSVDILAVRATPTQIEVDLDLFDFAGESVLAKLFRGETQIGSAITLSNNKNFIVFDGLEASTGYRLVLDYNNGARLLASRDIQTQSLVTLATPSADVTFTVTIEQSGSSSGS
jgi:hypothetical protein